MPSSKLYQKCFCLLLWHQSISMGRRAIYFESYLDEEKLQYLVTLQKSCLDSILLQTIFDMTSFSSSTSKNNSLVSFPTTLHANEDYPSACWYSTFLGLWREIGYLKSSCFYESISLRSLQTRPVFNLVQCAGHDYPKLHSWTKLMQSPFCPSWRLDDR